MLSVSPLLTRPFDAKGLMKHVKITDKERQKKMKGQDMPNRIEDLSPSPMPMNRYKSPLLNKYDRFKY